MTEFQNWSFLRKIPRLETWRPSNLDTNKIIYHVNDVFYLLYDTETKIQFILGHNIDA